MTGEVLAGDHVIDIEDLAARLFDDAAAIDRLGVIPDAHFDALAAAGLYGAVAPRDRGGAGLDRDELTRTVEVLASGCLATTFVWIQHLGLLGTLLDGSTPAHLRAELVDDVVAGRVRAGIALAGLLPHAPLRAKRASDGWLVDGEVPWVTGWGYLHVVQVLARCDDDRIVGFVMDAATGGGLSAVRQRLAAVDASSTVQLHFADVFVPDERVLFTRDHDPARARTEGLRTNGSLALGVARRCCALIGPSPLDAHLARCRTALDTADTEHMPAARAAASAFAVRVATALVVTRGSGAALAGDHGERLAREASFTLVFGSRPAIKAALSDRLLDG